MFYFVLSFIRSKNFPIHIQGVRLEGGRGGGYGEIQLIIRHRLCFLAHGVIFLAHCPMRVDGMGGG